MLRNRLRTLLCLLLVAAGLTPCVAVTKTDSGLDVFVSTSAHILRGRCLQVEVGETPVAGATVPSTTYTFEVEEYLKGADSSTFTFRQVGTPEGGPHDLGQLVGLPVYAPGVEYLLFVLPESRAGLTSPAGAGEAAFVILNERVEGLRGVEADPVAGPSGGRRMASRRPGEDHGGIPYETVKRLVLEEVTP